MAWVAVPPPPAPPAWFIYGQDKNASCVCACLATVIRLVKNKIMDESAVRIWVKEAEGGGTADFDGFRRFDKKGTKEDIISHVLNKFKIATFPVRGRDNVAKWIVKTSRFHPAIVGVHYPDPQHPDQFAGGHAIVAAGVDNGNVIILDPGGSANAAPVLAHVPVASLPEYRVRYPLHEGDSVAEMFTMRTTG